MTRIEEPPSFDPWLKEKSKQEKLKEDIREEVISEMKRKKRRKTLTCCVLELATVIFVLSLGTALLAKTGLVNIPLFSKIFYKSPIPQKIVKVAPEEIATLETDLTQKIKNQVESKIQPGASGQKIEVELEFSEKELTALLMTLGNQSQAPIRNPQVSISEESIEIFGEINEPAQTFLTIGIKPGVAENDLIIQITKVKIGDLSLPASWGNFFVNKFLKYQLEEVQESIGKIGKLENITLQDGKIILQGLVDVLVFTQEIK